jgi:hypothetical protein
MSTSEQARQMIVTLGEQAKVAWVGTPIDIQWDNRNLIDITARQTPYVDISMLEMGGGQLELGPKPLIKQDGYIVVTACIREDQGSAKALALRDHFLPYYELKDLSVLRTYAGTAHKSVLAKGWMCYPVMIPFWFTRVAQ